MENLVLNREKLNAGYEIQINELNIIIEKQKELIQFYENGLLTRKKEGGFIFYSFFII